MYRRGSLSPLPTHIKNMKKDMKKFFSMSVVLAVMALFCVSCSDTMDDKSDVEKGFAKYAVPAMTLAAEVEAYNTASAVITVDNAEGILEEGVYVVDEDGYGTYLTAKDVEEECELTVDILDELSTYELYPYVMMKSGEIIVGEKAVKVTTPKMPVFTVDGDYIVTEYEYNYDTEKYDEEAETYTMTITFTSGNEEEGGEVAIYNLWGSESTVSGTYDAETKTISIPAGQVIAEHGTYGEMWIEGDSDDDSIILTLDNINFKSNEWCVNVEAGQWGWYIVDMKRDLK